MPWCPKCKSEYEQEVKICAECKLELVDNLSDIVDWQVIIKARQEKDAEEVVEFLKYSGISKVKYEKETKEDEEYYVIVVCAKEVETATKFLAGYMQNKASESQQDIEEDEEEVINEYESENYKDDTVINDLKSSVLTFGVVGSGAIIISILVFMDILNISFSNKYLFSGLLAVIGVAFVITAINSGRRIDKEKQRIEGRDKQIESILEWFGDNYQYNYFQEKYNINLTEYDEGATYYVVVDKLKEEISRNFVDVDTKIINTASELIYERMNK